ncbi:cytochrome c-type biogenesis protein CcmF [Cohaesibacter sp. ES.047]|uniref:heme lyase CcmF/NrfE family subunit n=1 Tax=Cohaesibacter sp. ES.047 TaxID=1798205 RepID=UPI000BB6D97F|nr:heme lyase CcmF/NrfE family subunit [Cohaesibacter sp. ES.047]SNY92820.1 cytochrome c-type biogenesis protein CcmF [Cohaesibacter sp. ES.047]
MIVELGHFMLILAFVLALIQSVVPIWGAQIEDSRLMAVATPIAVTQFLFVGLSFAALTHAYVTSDFSVQNVWENSHSDMPLLFKFTSVWGNHEGSMLLWVFILVIFGALVGVFGRNLPPKLKANTLAVQGWITAAFLSFVLLTSNPFRRISTANLPIEGRDLNPILQDIGLAIHPPLLYLGYVGFSIAFAFSIAALLEGRIDAAWARFVRPWVLVAWALLTLGISMGSYWAYYELGWGGYWFWDPVENASFMPWLCGTALLHSAVVMEKRGALKVWTILLSILTFSLSLLGTFLVRSGVLTSVHAFATDPSRGVFILALLVGFIGGGLALFAWRAPLLKQGGIFAPISREGSLVFNNLFLSAATAAVLVGTLYPLALEATTGAKISVGAPFFNATFGPMMIPLLIAVPFGPLLAWKRGDLYGAVQRLYAAFGLSLLTILMCYALLYGGSALAPLGIGLAVWVMIGSLAEIHLRIGLFKQPFAISLSRLKGLPRTVWGTAFGHFGLGMTVLGLVVASTYQTENILIMKPGDKTNLAGYEFEFTGFKQNEAYNFADLSGTFVVTTGDRQIAELHPAKRIYTSRNMPTTETAIHTVWGVTQLYMSLGDQQTDGGIAVRIYYKPWVTFIWLGTIVMFIGGGISLSDRRLRIGAPARKGRAKEAAGNA